MVFGTVLKISFWTYWRTRNVPVKVREQWEISTEASGESRNGELLILYLNPLGEDIKVLMKTYCSIGMSGES